MDGFLRNIGDHHSVSAGCETRFRGQYKRDALADAGFADGVPKEPRGRGAGLSDKALTPSAYLPRGFMRARVLLGQRAVGQILRSSPHGAFAFQIFR